MSADLRTRLAAYYATRDRAKAMRLELVKTAIEFGLDQAAAMNGSDAAAFLEGVVTTKDRLADAAHEIERLLEVTYAPESNCSCHLSPPCGDCVEYSDMRDTIQGARDFLATLPVLA